MRMGVGHGGNSSRAEGTGSGLKCYNITFGPRKRHVML